MKYAVETGSVALIYEPRFINIGSGIQKFKQVNKTNKEDEEKREDEENDKKGYRRVISKIKWKRK
jgi:hypothetical protein